ncbi:TPA: hypothetical protein DIC21_01785 [Candidatus Uhrbacteria bacterium]|nr:hypothetical protein [Candidatus Uhrbacteria bacterium]
MPSNQVPLFSKPSGQSAEVHDLAQDLATEEIPGRHVPVVDLSFEPSTGGAEKEPVWKSRVRELRVEFETLASAAAEDDHARLSPEDVRVVKSGQIVDEVLRHVSRAESHEVVGLESTARTHEWEKFDTWLERILTRYGNLAESPKKKSA